MNFFIGDFSNALSSSIAFDAKIMADAGQFSSEYTDLICLSLRQVMGSGEIPITRTCVLLKTSSSKCLHKN